MSDEQETSRVLTTLNIIWIAMLMSLTAYLVVGLLAAPRIPSVMGKETFGTLRMALYAIGFVMLVAAGYVRLLLLAGKSRPEGSLQSPRDVEIHKYSGAVIISLAMCESIGICGLVLFLLGRNTTDLFLLLGISAAAMIYYRPKKEERIS